MRETKFIQQNKEKWEEFERTLDKPYADPDKLNDLFVQITDDLSYSRTFYPNRSVRVYLNGLAQRIFSDIYKKRRIRFRRLRTFWTHELPILVYESRRDFLIASLIFGLALAIGLVSCAMDPEFVEIMLGADYVEMTRQNIASGDPMAVYKERGRFNMSLAITMNNLWVAFLTFIMGAIYGVGTLAILIRNGVMVGAFQYFFVKEGLFRESFLTIWTHGTLEISAIIIAGAAGLTMGRGLAFPGTFSRMRSFQRAAKRGLKIMVGISPIFILAGFIEGYLTRQTETPDLVRLIFILGCLAFVIFYFGVYPRIQYRRLGSQPIDRDAIVPTPTWSIDFLSIKSSGQIFNEAFMLYRRYWRSIAWASLGASLLYCGIVFNATPRPAYDLFSFPSQFLGTVARINTFFINEDLRFLPFINVLIFGLFAAFVFRKVRMAYALEEETNPLWQDWLRTLPGMALLMVMLWTNSPYTLFIIIFLGAYPFLWMYTAIAEKQGAFHSIQSFLGLIGTNFGRILSVMLVFLMIGFLSFALLDTGLFWLYFDLVSWVSTAEGSKLEALSIMLQVGTSVFMIALILGLIILGLGILYYTLLEIQEAPGLRQKIDQIGAHQQIRGLEKE
jgi:uncharacterized membrane protein SpoIIM required for sporulation